MAPEIPGIPRKKKTCLSMCAARKTGYNAL